ncbi:MAG TPA: methylated-DNA--[protein]-cysteine S-methyltransferase [Rhizomicrobium sp.]|nr:methylated-DNA--[protein]-cysteine S-methyltransferase [Rhizomicrobium sp.]
MDRTEQRYAVFPTAHGFCAIAWSAKGVTRFRLPQRSAEVAERGLRSALPHAIPGTPPAEVAEAIDTAKRYFAGERVDFSGVPIDLGGQDALFIKIYDAARSIGWGRTTTYGALARQFGDGWEMAREVGLAMAQNPVPLIIPCHRVLAAGGKIGGFSAPGGGATKARMLELEGVYVGAPKPAQRSLEL